MESIPMCEWIERHVDFTAVVFTLDLRKVEG